MNKKLVSLIASASLLTLPQVNSFAKENFSLDNKYNLNLISENDPKNFSSFQMIHNSYLIYQDIFEQTKFGIERKNAIENNQIAKKFFDKELWNLCYISAIGGMFFGNYILNSIDKSGKLSFILNNIIALSEMRVLIKNSHLLNQNIKINIPLFYKTF
ncbi:Uncharacterised protein [uncultured archaeon]|nr:Uncharacterised protein [uncultured archaeon]